MQENNKLIKEKIPQYGQYTSIGKYITWSRIYPQLVQVTAKAIFVQIKETITIYNRNNLLEINPIVATMIKIQRKWSIQALGCKQGCTAVNLTLRSQIKQNENRITSRLKRRNKRSYMEHTQMNYVQNSFINRRQFYA